MKGGVEAKARLFKESIFQQVTVNIIPKFSVERTRAKWLISIFFNNFT
jgi:hypothetical protein